MAPQSRPTQPGDVVPTRDPEAPNSDHSDSRTVESSDVEVPLVPCSSQSVPNRRVNVKRSLTTASNTAEPKKPTSAE